VELVTEGEGGLARIEWHTYQTLTKEFLLPTPGKKQRNLEKKRGLQPTRRSRASSERVSRGVQEEKKDGSFVINLRDKNAMRWFSKFQKKTNFARLDTISLGIGEEKKRVGVLIKGKEERTKGKQRQLIALFTKRPGVGFS